VFTVGGAIGVVLLGVVAPGEGWSLAEELLAERVDLGADPAAGIAVVVDKHQQNGHDDHADKRAQGHAGQSLDGLNDLGEESHIWVCAVRWGVPYGRAAPWRRGASAFHHAQTQLAATEGGGGSAGREAGR